MSESEPDERPAEGDAPTPIPPEPSDGEPLPDAAPPDSANSYDVRETPKPARFRCLRLGFGRLRELWRCHPRLLAVSAVTSVSVAVLFGLSLNGAGALGSADEEVVELPADSMFLELPRLVTDLRPSQDRRNFIRVDVVVEIGSDQASLLQQRQPLVLDAAKSLLRDYDRADLVGSDGANRLRTDFRQIVDDVIAPARSRGVFFQQFVLD